MVNVPETVEMPLFNSVTERLISLAPAKSPLSVVPTSPNGDCSPEMVLVFSQETAKSSAGTARKVNNNLFIFNAYWVSIRKYS